MEKKNNIVKRKTNELTIVTSHNLTAKDNDISYEIDEDLERYMRGDKELFFSIDKKAVLVHTNPVDTHRPIKLVKGKYVRVIQQEYNPITEHITNRYD